MLINVVCDFIFGLDARCKITSQKGLTSEVKYLVHKGNKVIIYKRATCTRFSVSA